MNGIFGCVFFSNIDAKPTNVSLSIVRVSDGVPIEMPKLVPCTVNKMPPKSKPIHERLGKRDSVCESIHTSQLKLFRPMKFKAKGSVQSRLGRNFVSPAVVERNRIAVHALNTYAKSAANNLMSTDDVQGQIMINAFAQAIRSESAPPKKYDMQVQKEISYLQVSFFWYRHEIKSNGNINFIFSISKGKELYYACPGAFVISNDGPGVQGLNRIQNHTTNVSLNQRFA